MLTIFPASNEPGAVVANANGATPSPILITAPSDTVIALTGMPNFGLPPQGQLWPIALVGVRANSPVCEPF